MSGFTVVQLDVALPPEPLSSSSVVVILIASVVALAVIVALIVKNKRSK